MRKILLAILISIAAFSINAQNCSEIFISEYVHGLYNNRAMEFYNPTDNVVDLDNYRLVRWSNGGFIFDPLYAVELKGKIAPKDVYVIATDKRDRQGSGLEQFL